MQFNSSLADVILMALWNLYAVEPHGMHSQIVKSMQFSGSIFFLVAAKQTITCLLSGCF